MKYLKVFTDFVADMEELGDAERGRLFTAMLIYAETGEEPALRGNEKFLWGTAKKNIDNQRTAYDKQREVNKQNITKRYESLRTDTNGYESKQDKEKEKEIKEIPSKEGTKKSSAFVAPTLEEVTARCKEMGYTKTSPIAFISHYQSVGWKVGKNPMKDWKASLAGWESREQQFRSVANAEPKRKNKALDYKQTPISENDFSRMVVNLDEQID